ncbi:hypothetical protein [Streptomyces niveus]|uniref:hypothetical protein n=1 Tax=Streptomyces niveus TaxID=193462 RepID=UPI00365E76C5
MFFTVRINGTWRLPEDETPQHHDPAVLARHQAREHARRTLARYSVLDIPAAQDAVNAVIARWHDPDTGLDMYGAAQLVVGERERALAEEHLRTEQTGDLERQETRRRLIFLQRILSDPDLRLVWWIDRYPDRLGELTELEVTLGDLKPPRGPSHDALRDEIVRFVDQLLSDIRTPQQREVFLRALTQTLEALGSTELKAAAAQWLPANPPDHGSASV